MKAYQVFEGYEDKHGFQRYDLKATYFDKSKALKHCLEIVHSEQFKNEKIVEYETENGLFKTWSAVGYTRVTIAMLAEIKIIGKPKNGKEGGE